MGQRQTSGAARAQARDDRCERDGAAGDGFHQTDLHQRAPSALRALGGKGSQPGDASARQGRLHRLQRRSAGLGSGRHSPGAHAGSGRAGAAALGARRVHRQRARKDPQGQGHQNRGGDGHPGGDIGDAYGRRGRVARIQGGRPGGRHVRRRRVPRTLYRVASRHGGAHQPAGDAHQVRSDRLLKTSRERLHQDDRVRQIRSCEGRKRSPRPLVGRGARPQQLAQYAEQETSMRPSRRQPDELRAVSLERGVVKYAEGSCFVKFGDTHVLVTATLEDRLPPWLKGQARGWVTAEYGMLPRATSERTRREASAGKQSGRTIEIQRLIGRSLRAVLDLPALGERQITIDCDVIQADGGTRTAAITGAWVALHDCITWMKARDMVKTEPLRDHVAAISCGICNGTVVLDLDYAEDSEAETDANFVMTGAGRLVEIQGTAEKIPFTQEQFFELLALAKKGLMKLVDLQKMAVM